MRPQEADTDERRPRSWNLGWAILALVAAALAYVWMTRERIATDLIDDYLAETGLEATYEIAQIGAKRQILENIIVGDPAAPDLTIKRLVVDISYGFGAPTIGGAQLEEPRLFASYREGAFSLGALDALFASPSEEPGGLPSIDVTITQGRALLETDYGRVGAAIEGSGELDDGFEGTLALTAPGFGVEKCKAQGFTAYGEVTSKSGALRFDGPVRLRGAACEGVQLPSSDIALSASVSSDFARVEGDLDLVAERLAYDESGAQSVSAQASYTISDGSLILDHDVSFERLFTPYASLAQLQADGALRSARGFSNSTWNAQFEGQGINLAQGSKQALSQAQSAGAETFLAPLLAKFERNLAAAAKEATLDGDVTWRLEGDAQSLVIPEARLRSGEGDTLLAVSRLAWGAASNADRARLSGNFLTGGAGLPQVTGRLDQDNQGALAMRLSMAEYSNGADKVALPGLQVRQSGNGPWRFSGEIIASGAIPGGQVTSLKVPLSGTYRARSGLRLGSRCTNIRFDAVTYFDLALREDAVRVCPFSRQAMVSYNGQLDVDLVVDDLTLGGDLAGSPLQVDAARAHMRYPGGFDLTDLAASIGEPDNAVHLTSAAVSGTFDEDLNGAFETATARLDAVPLDLSDGAGRWSYTDETLRVSQTALTLSERSEERARFEPLVSRDTQLLISGSDILAQGTLLHPGSDTRIATLSIQHDLSSGEGSAQIGVPDVTFGTAFSPEDLTYLAKGVIAFTEGTITGSGQISWTSDTVSSTGVFRSDDLNLAAAFGPVTGLKGEIRFSDLLNLTTEPSQVITIGSINPGIEALAGTVRFSLTDGVNIDVEDARWPFMGGELIMRPTTLRYGTGEEQRYTFDIIDLDAAIFVTQMELTNLGASGTFSGKVPIIFDAKGDGRIEGGSLISQAPGGNVSYIGELTYEDLGTISNFAFQSLRSLDYRAMSVELDGDLAGEIVTRFQIDGVSQGEDASKNIITRRLAKLPIRFNVNVRSENFYELATMVRTFWDPDALPDPVDQGVLSRDGMLLIRPAAPVGSLVSPEPPPDAPPEGPEPAPTKARRPDEPGVQPPESEDLP